MQTADTGQINLATAAKPGTSNAAAGHEIFRFDDPEQATNPIFVRVRYGTAGGTTIPGINVSAGVGTDGAGNLTGVTDGSMQGARNAVESVSRPGFASIEDGHFILGWGLEAALSAGAVHAIERPRAQDGTPQPGISHLSSERGGTAWIHHIRRADGTGPAVSTSPPLDVSVGGHDDVAGADVALFPIPLAVSASLRWSSLLTYRLTAIGADTVQAVDMFGVSRNYRTLGGSASTSEVALAVPYY